VGVLVLSCGANVGPVDGTLDGLSVGTAEGTFDGLRVGVADGPGVSFGALVPPFDGCGESLGVLVGWSDGSVVGEIVGGLVGVSDGVFDVGSTRHLAAHERPSKLRKSQVDVTPQDWSSEPHSQPAPPTRSHSDWQA
jgi:hypothetical protein